MLDTAARLFVPGALADADALALLEGARFRDPRAALGHLRAMGGADAPREALGRVARSLLAALGRAPDPDAALVGLARYVGARPEGVRFLEQLGGDAEQLALLTEILGTSPVLSQNLIRHPEHFDWLLAHRDEPPPDGPALAREVARATGGREGAAALDALKRLQRRHLLRIAASDLLERRSLSDVAAGLALLADVMVGRALEIVLNERLGVDGRPRAPGRFAVIGMGKLGGQELNYSSDIDLIYVYEPDEEDDAAAHAFFHRLARKLTAALAEHTAESYLYRVDLRLRPMGRSGNVAHSLSQLRQYYDTWGVTFDRFALLKARPIAGDADLGRRFVDQMEPFVYRPYLDHAAFEEMYQHKARIDRAIERAERDRNVKLGRGGIREVELFTQVLQLTFGAREPSLRQRNTLAALEAMRRVELISETIADELARAYIFLRTVEHRLQIVLEEQTHTLSTSAEDLAICARRLRFDSVAALEAALDRHRQRVHELYGGLFERRRGTSDYRARQFFRILGDEVPVTEALGHLAECGFADAPKALTAISALGRHAAAASAPATARNVLANLLAASVRRLTACARPEVVLTRLEQFAVATGAPTLLARSLLENDALRGVLIDVLDHGELPSQRLIRYPELLDALGRPLPGAGGLRAAFDEALTAMGPLESTRRLDHLRRFKSHEEFKILVRWLATDSLDELQEGLSLLADCCTAHAATWQAPAPLDDDRRSWAVVALGKLGGTELTVHSDLDLVFVYEDDADPQDTGVQWQTFVESTQSLLAQPTGEGVAYRIDTRLRPEGTKGALAIPLPAFLRYLVERAEPWERLAWTRARIVVGSRRLADRISQAVRAFVYGPWDSGMPPYMHHIRMRMEHELAKERGERVNFKVGKGGLADIDFLLQLIQIREGHARADFRIPGTRTLLAALPSTRYLGAEEAGWLLESHRFLRALEALARMDVDADVNWIAIDRAAVAPLGKRMGLPGPSGERLLARLDEITERVRSIYHTGLARLSDPDPPRTGTPAPSA